MTPRRLLVAALLVCLAAAGCGSPTTVGVSPAPAQGAQGYDAQAKANRTRAESDARRLLALVVLPAGAVALATAPAGLPGPALGSPRSDTVVDLARYWQLPLPRTATEKYLAQHPPAGLTQWGTSSGSAGDIRGYGWAGTGAGTPAGQLEIGISGTGSTSYLRADALATWLDPHPLADGRGGPRLRLEAGDRCPGGDAGIAGVRNDGPGLDRALVPSGTPRGGLLCSFTGGNGTPFALRRQRVLTAAEAGRVAAAARQVDLGHPDGTTNCPMDDGAATVLVLDYPDRAAVDLWLRVTGCITASNGTVLAGVSDSLGTLFQAVHELAG